MQSWWIIRTITDRVASTREALMRMHNPPHPGKVLREYLGTMSVTGTARHLGVTRVALSRILNGSAGISASMALKLSDALGTSPDLWIGMQAQYDLWRAAQRHHKRVAPLSRAGRQRSGEIFRSAGKTAAPRNLQRGTSTPVAGRS
jgi:antitoxin HigA-1